MFQFFFKILYIITTGIFKPALYNYQCYMKIESCKPAVKFKCNSYTPKVNKDFVYAVNLLGVYEKEGD